MGIAKTLDRTISVSPERAQEASTDMTIVRRVQEGEVAAFDTLILKYRERIYSVIYNLTGNREDPEKE
jgi:RNA polymerase sigma-70 factor (ECF subfamily)